MPRLAIMSSTFGKSVAAAVFAAVIAYVMFSDSEPRTQLAVSAILGISGGLFSYFLWGSPRREE